MEDNDKLEEQLGELENSCSYVMRFALWTAMKRRLSSDKIRDAKYHIERMQDALAKIEKLKIGK